MEIIQPLTDDIMIYDSDMHQYQLTLSYAKSQVGNAYQNDAKMENRLKEISNTIYDHIYSNSNTFNMKTTQLILACSKEGRELIKQALSRQLKADADNGYNDINKQNPIDFQNHTTLDRYEIKRNEICVSCENILNNSSAYLDGYNIMSQLPIVLLPSFLNQFIGIEY